MNLDDVTPTSPRPGAIQRVINLGLSAIQVKDEIQKVCFIFGFIVLIWILLIKVVIFSRTEVIFVFTRNLWFLNMLNILYHYVTVT